MQFPFKLSSSLFTILLLLSCGNDPKVIAPSGESSGGGTAENQSPTVDNSQVHEVVVNDILQTDKYTYLYVTEDDEEFWIAVGKIDEVKKGEKYFYSGGLLKRNFYSREFDRNFETIYLVSRITPANGASTDGSALGKALNKMEKSDIKVVDVEVPEGAVSLEALFADPASFEGKEIQVRGQCMKANNAIMNRNWVHLQDGSTKDGEKLDLTVTTDEQVPVGAVVTMVGTINLNQDFGSGYRYDVIMEGARVITE